MVETQAGGIPKLVGDRYPSLFFSPVCFRQTFCLLEVELVQRPEFVPMPGTPGRDKLEREFPLSSTTHRHVDLYAALAG